MILDLIMQKYLVGSFPLAASLARSPYSVSHHDAIFMIKWWHNIKMASRLATTVRVATQKLPQTRKAINIVSDIITYLVLDCF